MHAIQQKSMPEEALNQLTVSIYIVFIHVILGTTCNMSALLLCHFLQTM